MEKQLSYEEATAKLQEIITKIDSGTIAMSEATSLFEEGGRLIKICYSHLDTAKGKLTQLEEGLSGLNEVKHNEQV